MATDERILGWVGVPAGLAMSWLLAVMSHSDVSVSRHWFYVPVVLAGVYLGVRWTAVTAVAAGLLAGPLVPGARFDLGMQFHVTWAMRAMFLIGIGMLVATLVENLRAARDREVTLARREQELARFERDVALQRDAVIQTVSHELRTPLTVINGGLELLVARQQIDGRLQPLVAAVLRATGRLTSLVSLVLAASDSVQVEDDKPVPVPVGDLIRNALGSLPPDERRRIAIDPNGLLTEVLTKPPFVETVLRSLLDNAVKFSPDGKEVEVVVRTEGGCLVVDVRDHGPGIDPEILGQVTAPFVQGDQSTTRSHGGLGLGLYTADKLVRRMGGALELAPHLDGGTVAQVRIPAPVVDRQPEH